MKKTLLLSFFLIFCVTLSSLAQGTGLLTGTIQDKVQKLSLPGAALRLMPGNRYTISNNVGRFEFLSVPAGTYTLEVNYLGFKPYSMQVEIMAGDAQSITVAMEEGGVMGKEVVVLGDRLRSQAKALNQQQNNGNITNIVSADQIGRFPDANIGDAMKRIPGITMQNDQGEARDIIIRGMAPELNSVTLNGDRIPSAEGDNRRVQMDLIPSDMIQTIEVNKTLTPDMDADAIGGSVNLVTRAAPNGMRVSGTLSAGYNPIRDKALYTGSFLIGNRFANNKLGAIVSASYNNNDYGSDNIEASYAQDEFGNAYMTSKQIRKYDVKRVRRSVSATLDYDINAKNKLYLTGMYNWRDDWENRFRVSYDDMVPQYDSENNIIGYKGTIKRQTKGGIGTDRVNNRRLEDQRVKNISMRGEHLLGSTIDLDWALTYADASEDRPNERYMRYDAEKVEMIQDLSNPRFPFADSRTPVSASNLLFNRITENDNYTSEREYSGRVNLRFPFSVVPEQKGRIRVGGRFRLKEKDRNNNFYRYRPTGTTADQFANLSLIPSHDFSGEGYQAGSQYAPGLFASHTFLGSLDLYNPNLFRESLEGSEFLAVNYNAHENITAGYLRWDQDFSSKLSMIVGVRLENTNLRYTGNVVQDEEDLEGQREIKNNYLNVLPSLTLKYNVQEDLILRAAFTTSLARPNYYDLVPYFDNRVDDGELHVGNPDLKAATAKNVDLMVEKYFKSIGIISGGAFYKNINNFIYRYRNDQYTTADFAADFPDVNNTIPADQVYRFQQPRNGESVDVYGAEVAVQRQLDFLPGFLQNMGVYANYTYTMSQAKGIYTPDGDRRENVGLPGTAPHMMNLSLSYEDKKFNARVSANYTAAYIDRLGSTSFFDNYYDEQFFLDANMSYKLNRVLRVFGEANNLTNQPLRYYQGTSNRTMQLEYYRPRYNFGIKIDL
ncbi:TonB-dependent receptor [Pontibacter sp. 13R65]|uniref:TonB-dependent receptor n=1 Tax=Pontibacter sp. 13R65 TaxID=3127458 RepID=UPI00301CB5E7